VVFRFQNDLEGRGRKTKSAEVSLARLCEDRFTYGLLFECLEQCDDEVSCLISG
jgi:hypothetical protein